MTPLVPGLPTLPVTSLCNLNWHFSSIYVLHIPNNLGMQTFQTLGLYNSWSTSCFPSQLRAAQVHACSQFLCTVCSKTFAYTLRVYPESQYISHWYSTTYQRQPMLSLKPHRSVCCCLPDLPMEPKSLSMDFQSSSSGSTLLLTTSSPHPAKQQPGSLRDPDDPHSCHLSNDPTKTISLLHPH